MLKATNRREFDIIMSWSVNRLGRSLAHLLEPLGRKARRCYRLSTAFGLGRLPFSACRWPGRLRAASSLSDRVKVLAPTIGDQGREWVPCREFISSRLHDCSGNDEIHHIDKRMYVLYLTKLTAPPSMRALSARLGDFLQATDANVDFLNKTSGSSYLSLRLIAPSYRLRWFIRFGNGIQRGNDDPGW
jgi:hypothetical protein